MRNPANQWLRRSGRVGVVVALALAAGVSASLAFGPWRHSRAALEQVPKGVVRRADLKLSLLAGGRIESTKKSVIECKLENLQFRSHGHALDLGGSSTILSIIPDGTIVKRGDVLCRLDSSDYEELVREQQIKVEEARATKLQADLDLQVAEMALHEFVEGTKRQLEQQYNGQIALARADVQRFSDRSEWSTRMLDKGYASMAQVATDRSSVQRAAFNLRLLTMEFEHFQHFTVPITLRTLGSDVAAARTNLVYQTLRLQRHAERLAHYEDQIEFCTIRAPHDGFAIYANQRDNDILIEEGARVHQRQRLFYLPDLSDMHVQTMIHESVVNRVHDGMTARVFVEALPGLILEGHVVSVATLPLENRSTFESDVKNFLGLVKLDSIPRGLRPGMTAEVEIVTGSRSDALVVPSEAVTVEQGEDVCYVAGQEGFQRRHVTLGSSTSSLLEVTEGLAEGEEVVLYPARTLLSESGDSEAEPPLETDTDKSRSAPEIPSLH